MAGRLSIARPWMHRTMSDLLPRCSAMCLLAERRLGSRFGLPSTCAKQCGRLVLRTNWSARNSPFRIPNRSCCKRDRQDEPMTRSERRSGRPWSVPLALADVPEAGRHLDLVADSKTRAAVAEHAGLVALPRLVASFDVAPYGRGGLRVIGRASCRERV